MMSSNTHTVIANDVEAAGEESSPPKEVQQWHFALDPVALDYRSIDYRLSLGETREMHKEESIGADDVDAPSLLCDWISPPEDIYGLLAVLAKTGNLFPLMIQKSNRFKDWNLGLGGDFTSDCIGAHLFIFFIVCLATFCAQSLLLWYIWRELSALNVSHFCGNPTFLHVMVISLMVIQFAATNAGPMICFSIFNGASHFAILNEKTSSSDGRLCMYRCIVGIGRLWLWRMVNFFFFVHVYSNVIFFIVGVRYILQQDGASNIIQACVAFQFILDIDNQVHTFIRTK